MTARQPSASPTPRRPTLRALGVGGALALLAGCGTGPRVDVPAELPLRVNEQLFTIRYALQREPTVVRAVGRIVPSIDSEARLTLALFGLGADGRIVSRGTTYVRSEFRDPTVPFAVELTPSGREAIFELRVLEFHLPGLRMS